MKPQQSPTLGDLDNYLQQIKQAKTQCLKKTAQHQIIKIDCDSEKNVKNQVVSSQTNHLIFKGIVVLFPCYSLSLTKNRVQILTNLIQKYGGTTFMEGQFFCKRFLHGDSFVVVAKDCPQASIQQALRNLGLRPENQSIVTSEWITECIAQGRLIDSGNYCLQKGVPKNTIVLEDSVCIVPIEADNQVNEIPTHLPKITMSNQIAWLVDYNYKQECSGPRCDADVLQTSQGYQAAQLSEMDSVVQLFTQIKGISPCVARTLFFKGFRNLDDLQQYKNLNKLQLASLQHFKDTPIRLIDCAQALRQYCLDEDFTFETCLDDVVLVANKSDVCSETQLQNYLDKVPFITERLEPIQVWNPFSWRCVVLVHIGSSHKIIELYFTPICKQKFARIWLNSSHSYLNQLRLNAKRKGLILCSYGLVPTLEVHMSNKSWTGNPINCSEQEIDEILGIQHQL